MENLIVIPIVLIITSVGIYIYNKFYKENNKPFDDIYEDTQKTNIVYVKDSLVKKYQVWTKDASLQDPKDPFYKAINVDVEVVDIETSGLTTFVQYRILGRTEVTSTNISSFLNNATLKN